LLNKGVDNTEKDVENKVVNQRLPGEKRSFKLTSFWHNTK